MYFKLKWLLMVFVLALTVQVGLASSTTVRADDYQCTGPLGAVRVDNLVVPDNSTCIITGTIVDGNIFIQTNATLHAYGVQVSNDIQANSAERVNIYAGSSVGGNIQILGSGAADIQSVDIDNNLLFDGNDQPVTSTNNNIGGNLQAFKNTGGVSINDNNIGGNLQCKENFPLPTGAGNIVSGNMEDQCANFGRSPTPTPANTPQVPTKTPGVPTQTPQAPTSTPLVDKQAPTVQWIAPVVAGEIYYIGEEEQVVLEVGAWDNGSITQVRFFRWDAVNLKYVTIGTLDQAPFRINTNARSLNPEWNQVYVEALDAAGNKSDLRFIWLYKLVAREMSSQAFIPLIIK